MLPHKHGDPSSVPGTQVTKSCPGCSCNPNTGEGLGFVCNANPGEVETCRSLEQARQAR